MARPQSRCHLRSCCFVHRLFDRRKRGQGHGWRAVWIAVLAGLIAAVAYDVFRLPFVFAKEWGLDSVLPPLKLFKVFPRFGAMVLAQQSEYSLAAYLLGWHYHFSNGATFGVMYLTLIGAGPRRHWLWAVLFAIGLELGMLLTPYPRVLNIPLTARFVFVTLAAHAIFGAGFRGLVRWLAWRIESGCESTASRRWCPEMPKSEVAPAPEL